MKMQYEEWQQNIINDAIENDFEIINDIYVCNDYVEINGTIGGDSRTFRYYKDGSVGER